MMQILEYGVFAQIVKMDGKSALSQVVKDLTTRNRWTLVFNGRFFFIFSIFNRKRNVGLVVWEVI